MRDASGPGAVAVRTPRPSDPLLSAVLAIGRELSARTVLDRTAEAAVDLTHATRAELTVLGRDGEVADRAAVGPEVPQRPGLIETITVAGAAVGTLRVVRTEDEPDFTPADADALATLAEAAGAALGNAHRYERGHRREEWLRATNEVTAVLRTGPPAAEGFGLLARRAREIPGAVLAMVMVPESADTLVAHTVDGVLADRLTGARLGMTDSITGDVYSTGRPRAFEAIAEATIRRSARTFRTLGAGIGVLGPAAFVPLGQQPIGVLVVAKAHGAAPFDDDDIAMIASYAGHAALAVEFAEAQQDRQRLALYEERDRIARDLHDLVIQRLFAIGLGLQGLGRAEEGAPVAPRLAGFVGEIDTTIRDIRRSIFSLQQPANGPYSARGEILRAISEATVTLGFEPSVSLDGPLDSVVPPEIQLDLIATLRETLSNVVRHALASQVMVSVVVDRTATMLVLSVRDDGAGLPAEVGHRGGLTNIARRAERWGGRCHVDSPDGRGTRIDWQVPLRGREN
ncbi:GAF domain-containing protein [Actinokineospora sp. UTMC 2448]|uniref:GAF domain-containing sensor histidine kinase n=1 Tax=Actinokineospora sp. UTMC 2448 TaxID=2268449 RepID=UPI00216474D8|nr:histidine kinase [Actinokineospora sp. UTMC 2448]